MRKYLKRGYFIFFLIIGICIFAKAQTTITLRPNATDGKDAYIADLLPDDNYGTHPDFASISGTNDGTPVLARSLV